MAVPRPLIVPGCYNALIARSPDRPTARLPEHAGHEVRYMRRYGTSRSLLGLPDAGDAGLL
jgi:hypothetical protein